MAHLVVSGPLKGGMSVRWKMPAAAQPDGAVRVASSVPTSHGFSRDARMAVEWLSPGKRVRKAVIAFKRHLILNLRMGASPPVRRKRVPHSLGIRKPKGADT